MGMVERGDGAGFALEALTESSWRNLMATTRLRRVSRALDFAHTAGADSGENFVWSETRARR